MKAIIPVAGYATRLFPLTKDSPKSLLGVGGKPMIEHVIGKITKLDAVDHIYIVTNNKFYKHFVDWKDSFEHPIAITIVNDMTMSNEDRLGSVGDMHFAIDECKIDDDCLVIGGDNLFEFNLKTMHDYFEMKNTSAIAARDLFEKSKVTGLGVMEIDDASKVIGFEEKPEDPKSTLAATMVYMFKRQDLRHLYDIVENGAPDNAGDFIKHLAEQSHVHAYVFSENWYDIGSHEQLEEVRRRYGKD